MSRIYLRKKGRVCGRVYAAYVQTACVCTEKRFVPHAYVQRQKSVFCRMRMHSGYFAAILPLYIRMRQKRFSHIRKQITIQLHNRRVRSESI